MLQKQIIRELGLICVFFGARFVLEFIHLLKTSIMLVKLNLISPAFARRERVTRNKAALTKKQWVNADRIVMAILFLVVVAGAVFFS